MIEYKKFYGKEIEQVLLPLAELRIEIFYDFPYLYEGTLAYEKEYLQTYINAERSLLVTVFDDDNLVGATTCLPLIDETNEVQKPFVENGIELERQFYLGESILKKNYRGKGIGVHFFEERENHASSFQQFEATWFCAVERPINHPMKPHNYVSLESFWQNRGYSPQPTMKTHFSWKDRGELEETLKSMNFWRKTL